jgi:ATP-dependent helicase/nuclease subunit B
MPVVWTSYGAPAHDALGLAVAEAKDGDPLAPVSVLVPANLCGVAARRVLARGVAGRGGVAGLSVLTVDRLAERIAAPALTGAGRRPATNAVLAAAWRRALAEDAGVFAPVAAHPATVQALADRHRELREVDEAALDAIAGSGKLVASDLVRLHRVVAGSLAARWYDPVDLRRTAAGLLRGEPRLACEIGAVVLFLPQELPLSATDMLRELADGDMRVVAGMTGDARADAAVLENLRRMGVDEDHDLAVAPAMATSIVHASDPDDEVRCVVRLVVGKLAGVPAERVAVLYGSAEPYARLLAEHFGAAGITTNGAAVRPVIERTLPRALLDLLALPDHGWRRDEVLALLAQAPVRAPDGHRVPAARWERISRAAGVVAGGDWESRLSGYAAAEQAAAAAERKSQAPRQGLIARRERDAEAADALRAFVAGLKRRLDRAGELRSWPDLAQWAADTFRVLLGGAEDEPWLPEDEARAAAKVQQVVAGLSGLGAVEPAADLTALRLTLDLELADDLPRQGRFGTGVLVAPLGSAIGLEVDVVFVVGLAEGMVPGRLHEDGLLPERVRALASGQLAPLRNRFDRQHRHLLAALVAAPERVASFPRGDLRRSTVRLPSRWLLPSLRALAGEPGLQASQWASVSGPWLAGSPSYAASLARTPVLASEQEWRIRAAIASRSCGGTVADALPGDVAVRRAVAMIGARASDLLTRFDGDVSGLGVPDPAGRGQVVSPTALEAWARCPHAYFVQRLLRVEPAGAPEELIEISPLDAGSLIHEVLDRFFTVQSQKETVPRPGQRWTAAQRAELGRIAAQTASEFEDRGVTGHPVLWRRELGRILGDLQLLLDDDDQLRADEGRVQVRSELAFGMQGMPPVPLRLPDGREVRFRGSADRVDQAGDALVVVDYKTGSARRFRKIGEMDPTAGGTKLQLPVYAHAARAGLGLPEAAVSAEYWFLRKDQGTRIAVPLTAEVDRAFSAAVDAIADGIGGGLFPHRPPEDDGWAGFIECPYCDPDGLGVTELRDGWQRKRTDPRLASYLSLTGPDPVPVAP